MKLTGAEIVIKCLEEQGVDTVFGYPGGAILNVYDALYKNRNKIRHFLTSHEQGAAHAADGYARATGRVGVCLATSGPGATNLVTGIATAYMDSVPLVAITCNVTLPLLGKDSFQEVDIAGISMPITKHGFIVKDVNILADTIRRAFVIASSGRPGPVLIDITKDVTGAKCEYVPPKDRVQYSIFKSATKKRCDDEDIRKAATMLLAAKKPFLYVGGGAVISGASEELKELAELIDAPVCDSLMGKGAFDGHDPRYTGMIGMHGTKASNFGVSQCDMLVSLGARFTDRVTGNPKKFASRAKILHIDIDAAEINKNVKVDFSIVGDLKEVLVALNRELRSRISEPVDHKDWLAQIAQYKERYPLTYDHSRLTCPMLMQKLDELTEGKAIITTDVGQHQMWAAQYYTFSRPRTFLTSGGLGTMGYGIGAAIGAQVACPDDVVINIGGDGCFRMNMNELATASRYNIPIIEIVVDNRVLGMVRQWQTLYYGKRYSAIVIEDKVDYCKVAEGLGCKAFRVTRPEELESVLKEALALREPVLIDAVIEEDDKVFPMVSPGASIEEAFDEADLKAQGEE
ncbi:MAG: biosynthetic-type acetolactate synthase large subunit [Lachnospiraceae bacterium]|nr:biosynthetic-type acetolactate synthase large subunit [Lachnospiraceae bacterium]